MSALSDLINQALERRGWSDKSLRDLAAATDDIVSKDAWAGYRNGRHGTPREHTLAAMSEVLDLSMVELRAAAGVPVGAGTEGPYAGPPESARLSQRQRTAIDELIRSIVTSGRLADEEPQQDEGRSPSSITGRSRRSRGTSIAAVPDRPVEPDWSDTDGMAARRVPRELRDPNYLSDDDGDGHSTE